jgi:hypothetical protein
MNDRVIATCFQIYPIAEFLSGTVKHILKLITELMKYGNGREKVDDYIFYHCDYSENLSATAT